MLMFMNELEELEDDFLGDLGLNSDSTVIDPTDNQDLNLILEDYPTNKDNSLVDELLKSKGIKDNKIVILKEDNSEELVNFNDLSKQEQLEILSSGSTDTSLSKEELDFIEDLKSKNLTIDQYLLNYKENILSELRNYQDQTYDIDSYDDNELFLYDLKAKYDLSDEELSAELEKELQNESIFKKKVDKLRVEYKQLEDQYRQNQIQELEREKEAQYNEFSDSMVNIAIKTPDFYGIELDENEKEEVLSHILDLDENGVSDFYKSLNNPTKLYELAWFSRYGKEAFEYLKNAYETEIAKIKKDAPRLVKKGISSNDIPSIYEL